MKKWMLRFLLIVAVLAVGLWVPSEILTWQDQKKLGDVLTEEAEEVVLTRRADLTMIEKLQLLQKDQVISLPAAGKNYNEETILNAVDRELEKLANQGIISRKMAELHVYDTKELEVLFFVDMDDSSRSMRVWLVNGYNTESHTYILLDDDTGKILSLYQHEDASLAVSETEKSEQKDLQRKELLYTSQKLEETAVKWGEYLGCTLVSSAVETDMDKNLEKEQEISADGEYGIYAVYEDEHGKIGYLFQKEVCEIIFSASPIS